MVIVIPAIKGKIGNTVYYEGTMKVQDFVNSVSLPSDMDEWGNSSIEERMQRNPDTKRIDTQLAPYIANERDRFFGSVIVLIYSKKIRFEPIKKYASHIPQSYQSSTGNMGFLIIDEGASMIVLDGQHRRIALQKVCERKVDGEFARDVLNDDICVIFIEHENREKTRRIFNTVNRYAKQTNRSDNIITSEDDGYAIISRRLLQEGAALAKPVHIENDIVNWRSNTLTGRSTHLTTISIVYETVKLILDHYGVQKFQQQTRPLEKEMRKAQSYCETVWSTMLKSIEPYKRALKNPKRIPELRHDRAREHLLFKPAAQIAIVEAVLQAVSSGNISLDVAMKRVNLIDDWSINNTDWRGLIIKQSAAIDATQTARRRMAKLVCYLIAADCISCEVKFDAWKNYNKAKGINVYELVRKRINHQKLLDLPKPVKGTQYTAYDGLESIRKEPQSSDMFES